MSEPNASGTYLVCVCMWLDAGDNSFPCHVDIRLKEITVSMVQIMKSSHSSLLKTWSDCIVCGKLNIKSWNCKRCTEYVSLYFEFHSLGINTAARSISVSYSYTFPNCEHIINILTNSYHSAQTLLPTVNKFLPNSAVCSC
jgi:hypothetical protein